MADTTALHLAYRRQLQRITNATTAAATAAKSAELQPWLEQVIPSVLTGQRAAVRATDAYMSLEAGLATNTSTRPWGLDPDRIIGARARHGVPLEDVYGRNLRSDYGTLAYRLAREVATDITLAQRESAWIHTKGDPRIVGYRRTLGAGPNCALCVAAATRVYKSETLQPIHSHCGCSQSPVYGDGPSPKVDKAFLNSLYDEAGSNRYGDLRRIQVDDARLPANIRPAALKPVQVVNTPELGPTLQPA